MKLYLEYQEIIGRNIFRELLWGTQVILTCDSKNEAILE